MSENIPPKEIVWRGGDTPLENELVAFFNAAKIFDLDNMLSRFDTENGFALVAEDIPDILNDEEKIKKVFGAEPGGLAGWYIVNEIVDTQELGTDYVSLIANNKGVYYSDSPRPHFYIEFRAVYVLRRDGDSFKIVYQVEAPLAPISYLWKLHTDTAEPFLSANGQKMWTPSVDT